MRQLPRPTRRLALLTLVVATASLAVIPSPATADAVYMKDGLTLHGKVRREADVIFDPVTGAMIPIIKASQFFIVDDKVRWVLFRDTAVQDANPEVNIRSDFISLTLGPPVGQERNMPAKAAVRQINPFTPKWNRTVQMTAFIQDSKFEPERAMPMEVQQRLAFLSPYAAVVHTQRYRWNMSYLTGELGLNTVRSLLDAHPDLVEEKGPDVDRRLKRFRFLLQGGWPGWLLAAGEELDRAAKDLPKDDKDVKDRLERARVSLRQAQVQDLWEEIQTAHRAGRYRYVRAIFGRLPLNEIDAGIAAAAAALKAKYDGWDRQAADLIRLLNFVDDQIVGPPRPVFAAAEAVIRDGAGPDTFERVEPFLTIAGQYERDLKAGKVPTYSPESVLAVAVSGWVMGMPAAEPSIAAAERYWTSREFVLTHARTHDAANRQRLFDTYQAQNPLSLDEVTQLIGLLPPADPPAAGPTTEQGVEERKTEVPWTKNPPVPYVVHLPPEYRATRAYPVLIVLHGAGERPSEALVRWAGEAGRQGYIVAAPEWGGAGGYNYTTEEHNAVTELVKDLRRKYSVDSDRVFLTGYGDGGTMAFDVGMSHPDLFTGVVPVCGRPRKSTVVWYWRNAQYLPFYIVTGEQAGDVVSLNRGPFESWMTRGYASLMTIYKGRPMEPFPAEQPFAFDWMNRKKRATGFPQLGRNANSPSTSEEFQSMRPGDDHFYWVSIQQIHEKYVNHEIGMKIGSPAALQAQVRDNNQVYVYTRGIKSLRMWFGRIWDAQSGWRPMIDFAKPVKITVNGRVWGGRDRQVQPSLQTLLDDLYQRGDRQRMFSAYIDLTGLQ